MMQRITVYGRKPVMEALSDGDLSVEKVFLARGSHGASVSAILELAQRRGVEVRRMPAEQISRISKNARQDQGVAADIAMRGLSDVVSFVEELEEAAQDGSGKTGPIRMMALDGITTQENAGMIIRSAMAAGLDGIVMGSHGTAKLDPKVIKASAGTAFKARILACEYLEEGLADLAFAGFEIIGLDGGAKESLFDVEFPERCVLVIGNESTGIRDDTWNVLTSTLRIPMKGRAESLNAACAATLASFELMRRG